jgi:hypothetical protein
MPATRQDDDVFNPPFEVGSSSLLVCRKAASELADCESTTEDIQPAITRLRARLLSEVDKCAKDDKQQLRFIISVFCDLKSQGWTFHLSRREIRILRPNVSNKIQVRASHAVGRDKQLEQPSVRQFIRKMEKKRLKPSGWVSVCYSLMRDGRELVDGLRSAVAKKTQEQQMKALKGVIDPYIQIVRTGAVCDLTGYELSDIWRYFRHTWATSYKSAVGRELKVLIRDRATKYHAVIGIGAMVSPRHLVHVDRWVGWERSGFLKELDKSPSKEWACWLDESLTDLIGDIYVEDFIADKLIKRGDLKNPKQEVIGRLETEAESARAAHRLYPEQAEHKGEDAEKLPTDWVARAKTHLYRGNRAMALADLLKARLILSNAGFKSPTAACLARVIKVSQGRDAVGTVLKYVKSVHAGINVLDISVCGAVPPYSPLLGGKLVAMLLTSPEIVQAYADAYSSSPSIIASAMAGRPVVREPHLVLLTTSSLYGDALNQYTRVAVPAREVGGESPDSVRYKELGKTLGQGSHHISDETVEEAEILLAQRADGHRVNSIFGEGVNPRLRKIRGALDLCGFRSDYVLEHGNPRVLYGVALASNFRDMLLGRTSKPRYVLPQALSQEVSAKIADYWRSRWLHGRIAKGDALEKAASHTLIEPIQHGARVVLPEVDGEEGPLFRQMG